MTDQELVLAAAKAAGIALCRRPFDHRGPEGSVITEEFKFFNPLHDDGDALRLAVKLGIERIFVLRLGPNGVCIDGAQEPQTVPLFEHSVHRVAFDQYAATRRAIVRAAAAIGKALP